MKITQELFEEITKIVKTKHVEYGHVDDASVRFLQTIYPDGISPDKYDDAIFSLRVLEKISRVCSTNISEKAKSDAYQDIVGYGLLGLDANKNNTSK